MDLSSKKNIKIGFLGNMNNNPFMLARHFKQNGYEVVFVIFETDKLYRPECRYSDVTLPYPDWIKDCSPLDFDFFTGVEKSNKFKEIITILNACDYLVLNGYAIRFKEYFKPKHFCLLTGSDLISLADYNFANKLYKTWVNNLIQSKRIPNRKFIFKLTNNPVFFKFVSFFFKCLEFDNKKSWFISRNFLSDMYFLLLYKIALYKEITLQRDSIRSAMGLVHFSKGIVKESDVLLESIGINERVRVSVLLSDLHLFNYTEPKNNAVIRVFNVARFNWIKSKAIADFCSLDYKGNDVMIRGIALFYNKHKTPLDIVFVRKGFDVTESEDLCKELGINHLITWRDVLSQREVQEEYEKADIVFDQLDQSVVTMGGFDAMAVGRPLIANARAEVMDKLFGAKTEVCDAKNQDEVCSWLEILIFDKEYRIEKGKRSRDFVVKHLSGQNIVNGIEKIMYNKN